MQHESYIKIALELAKKGSGIVGANPLAGLIVVKNGKILTASFNGNSGIVNSSFSVIKNSNKSLHNSTLYTNIEPGSDENVDLCDELINSGITKIVVGCSNPGLADNKRILSKLKKNNIEVVENVLEEECLQVNKFYFKYIKSGLPFITLKMASTLDGKIADQSGDSKWITSVESRSYVHELRAVYDAVMVGAQTVKADDPLLNVRLIEGRNPKRIILDSKLSLSLKRKIFSQKEDRDLYIITSEASRNKKKKIAKLVEKGINIIFVKEDENGKLKLRSALKKLAKEKITSILVEGGGKVFTSFVKQKLFDNILIFYGPKIMGRGMPLINDLGIDSINKALKIKIKGVEVIGEDAVINLVKR